MKTLKKVEIEPVYVELMPPDEEIEERKIYISKEYETAIHLCLCGCKRKTVTPLIDGMWTLTEKNGKISLTPSIANNCYPCKSHYIITDNIANFVGGNNL